MRSRSDRFWRNRDVLHATHAEAESKKQAAAGSKEDRTKEAKKGIDLPGWLFMARLRKLNPNLFFERSIALPENMGIYFLDPLKGKSFVTAFPAEHINEFETKVVDEHGNPRMPLRGWRTVLTRLIQAKFITESAAYSLFGPPSRDSENWALYMGHREVKNALR